LGDRLEKDIFEGVRAVVQAAEFEVAFGGGAEDVLEGEVRREDHLPAAWGELGAGGAEGFKGGGEAFGIADCFHFNEALVGAAFGLEVGVVDNPAVVKNNDFLAGVLDIAEEVGAEDDVHAGVVAHLADHAEHAEAGWGIEAVGGFIEDDEFGAVDDGLGELGELFHAERVGAELTVAGFAEADIEEGLMSPLESGGGGQAGELTHHADVGDGGHAGDEGVVLRHEADEGADEAGVLVDVVAEDARRPGGGRVEAKEGIDEGGLAGAVRAQQADGAALEGDGELMEDGAATQLHGELIELDDWCGGICH